MKPPEVNSMDSSHQICVPLRSGSKKIRKRRELNALIANSIAKRRIQPSSNICSQDVLLSCSTDDAEENAWVQSKVVINPTRCTNWKCDLLRICKPTLLVVLGIFFAGITFWLYLDLRQQIYENDRRIEEVVAASKNLPNNLQRWHEKSSSLEKDQTILSKRLNEIQQSLEVLHGTVVKYKSFDAQNIYKHDEKLAAEFGAKIEAIMDDMRNIKDHCSTVAETQKTVQNNLQLIEDRFDVAENRSSQASIQSLNCFKEVNTLKSTLTEEVNKLQTALNAVNNSLLQTSNILHNELIKHKEQSEMAMEKPLLRISSGSVVSQALVETFMDCVSNK